MFKNVEKNKIMLEGAYRKVKNYYYYNKNFIIMREKIADFESDEKKMDETFDIMAYHLSHESSKKSVDYFNMLIRQIDFFVLPKKFESVSSSKKSFISNTVPKNKKMKTVNFFIELPQVVQTVQKQTTNGKKLKFKQQTDFVFQAESVLFLFEYDICCKS